MGFLSRLFRARVGPDLSSASVIQPALAVVGVVTFLAGALYLPVLAPTRVEMIMILLLLASVALLCTAVGQLAAGVAHELRKRYGHEETAAMPPEPEGGEERPPAT